MDLKEMNNFLKIAEYENITKASQELHIAQPHLTRQIQALENELGVILFRREKKRLHITEEGQFFKQQAEQILGLVDKTKEQIKERESGLSGTLFIGAIETAGTKYLPTWIADFKEKYPNVKYNLWSGNSSDVIERLDKGLLDVALIREPFDIDKFDSIFIANEHWIALLNREHEMARSMRKEVTIQELESEELLVPTQRMNEIRDWFTKENLQNNIICSFSPLMNAVMMVERNLGIAILPESSKCILEKYDVVLKRLQQEKTSGVCLIWRRQYELSGVAERFLENIKDINNIIRTKETQIVGFE